MQGMPRRPEQASLAALKVNLTRDEQTILCSLLNAWGLGGAYATYDNWMFFTVRAASAALNRDDSTGPDGAALRDNIRTKIAAAVETAGYKGKAKSRVEVREAKRRLRNRINPLDIDRLGKDD